MDTSNTIEVYCEIGKKRTFACAVDWPGWSRSGRDEDSALQALFDYGQRYARILQAAQIDFQIPADVSAFVVTERLEGDASTDFGAPGAAPSYDKQPVDEAELVHFRRLLQAYWQAFDTAVQQATGKELRKGPRGGGRDLDKITEHVLGGDSSYLSRINWKFKESSEETLNDGLVRCRQAVLEALDTAVHEGIPERGKRGGVNWTPRYFVRRSAWHLLDHLWEIEDRII
ncbi:MAG: hypothetical protein H6669_01560 [Ardenticatenaceae bacterium]|nr:hypothetical protein [Ardenticatenaceae bacterium]